ncbi:hypothetical protein [Paracoccus salsus]|uniref:hypothetical protein n=1 Tax=Paracoccus salsus TaxID=2911061 RepID=UPI001F1B3453|nr:hypothetical protein [Paracoccus salsus]MCF3973622.1 hypothetical protein [Paracoccus salsus]
MISDDGGYAILRQIAGSVNVSLRMVRLSGAVSRSGKVGSLVGVDGPCEGDLVAVIASISIPDIKHVNKRLVTCGVPQDHNLALSRQDMAAAEIEDGRIADLLECPRTLRQGDSLHVGSITIKNIFSRRSPLKIAR